MEAVKEKQNQLYMTTTFSVLFAISAGHLVNDSLQAVVVAMFPILERSLQLSYAQIGWIAFVVNMTSSVMQPVFGLYADAKPTPFLLPFGMFLSLIGLIGFAFAPNFLIVLISVFFIGLGSAVFHPEGARVAYMAAGNKRGLAQSIYQVGGNFGQSLAPLFTAFIFVPLGQRGAVWFALVAAVGITILTFVSQWYSKQMTYFSITKSRKAKKHSQSKKIHPKIKVALVLLVFIVFARSWYSAGIANFYQFYLIGDYGLSVKQAQLYVFIFMIAGVLGTFLGVH